MSCFPTVVVHGGAWAIPEELWEDSISGVKAAAIQGYKVLLQSGSALDSVESSIVLMENDPVFDAGKGSVLTLNEEVEMDAMIMEGKNLRAGAVAAIKNIQNPIRVARIVMEQTPHVLVVGSGANELASLHGIATVSTDDLVTQQARDELYRHKRFRTTIGSLFSKDSFSHDTVGCVALAPDGTLACGTSTGGITAKMPGRVGDSPIVGAGGYADDKLGGVSCTGNGEAILKCCLALRVLEELKSGASVNRAARSSLEYMSQRINGHGGVISVSRHGDVAIDFTTVRMAWAYVTQGRLHYGLHRNEHIVEECPSLDSDQSLASVD